MPGLAGVLAGLPCGDDCNFFWAAGKCGSRWFCGTNGSSGMANNETMFWGTDARAVGEAAVVRTQSQYIAPLRHDCGFPGLLGDRLTGGTLLAATRRSSSENSIL